jgi:hypothetical protein
MASIFKTFSPDDKATTTTNLHEVIPITGTIVSGTYSDNNIKNYSHAMFQSVYDYPYLSSSANHIFDITVGYSSNSGYSSSASTQNEKKINIYNEFAKVLVDIDVTGNIQNFDTDGDISGGGTKMKECIFLPFSRLLVKDEIKKGSVQLTFLTGGAWPTTSDPLTLYDAGATTGYKVNSPAGEYGLLYTSSAGGDPAVGHIYYQAGIAVITASVFLNFQEPDNTDVGFTIEDAMTASNITGAADGLRHRIKNLQFNNTTELNSTVYFCRASSNEFNYSGNPTYLSSSQIVMKNFRTDIPASYVTTVGLYSADNELLAVAKLSEPLKKDPTNELTLRVRLDY